MRALGVAVALCLFGCEAESGLSRGAEASQVEGGSSPGSSLSQGTGWWCSGPSDIVPLDELLEYRAFCNESHFRCRKLTSLMAKSEGGYVPCWHQERAACFQARDRWAGDAGAERNGDKCFPTLSGCRAQRDIDADKKDSRLEPVGECRVVF